MRQVGLQTARIHARRGFVLFDMKDRFIISDHEHSLARSMGYEILEAGLSLDTLNLS